MYFQRGNRFLLRLCANNDLIFTLSISWHYFGCDFSDCCPHLYCDMWKHNVSPAVSSGHPQVSLVYVGIEMILPGKSFLKFDFPRLNHFNYLNHEEGRRIQLLKRCVSTYHNKDEDNSSNNHNQNNAYHALSQKSRQVSWYLDYEENGSICIEKKTEYTDNFDGSRLKYYSMRAYVSGSQLTISSIHFTQSLKLT